MVYFSAKPMIAVPMTRQRDREAHDLELLQIEQVTLAPVAEVRNVGGEVRVDGGVGQEAGRDGAAGSADGVNAKDVERVIITEEAASGRSWSGTEWSRR